MPPLVSILLPNLNTRRFLKARLDSLIDQTFTDWEMVVSDNYSDDGAYELFCEYADRDPRILVEQAPREGMYANWNACARRARGKYIYVATSDDTCSPDCLEKMVAALEEGEGEETEDWRLKTEDRSKEGEGETEVKGSPKHEESGKELTTNAQSLQSSVFSLQSSVYSLQSSSAALPLRIAVCNFNYIDENGKKMDPPLRPAGAFYGDDRYRAHVRSGYLEFLVHLLIGTSWTTMTAVLFPRALLEKTGLFRTDCGALADRCWAYKAAVHADTVVVPETLATWRQHAEQGSSPGHRRPPLQRMKALRQLYRATAETVDECEPLLPAAWKKIPAYRDKLLWAERRHYLDHYHLDRSALRHRPREFFTGALCALALEPAYLLRRLASGLAWEPDHDLSEAEYLHRMLGEFGS